MGNCSRLNNENKNKKIGEILKTLGYEWKGSGISVHDNIRDISFKKIS